MGVELVLGLPGGLALFTYGMQMMSTNLEAVAGDRIKQIPGRLTANRLLGVLVSARITALIRSPPATTVMTVGSVNPGLTTLKQAVWIIMGANVGTTITGQLIALDIGTLIPLIVFVGVMSLIFLKNKKVQHVGGTIAGVGVLFIGMSMISDAMVPLRDPEIFIHMVTKFSNPLLGTLVGTVFTAIIQSLSAPVGTLQALTMGGVINLHNAVFVPFGQNIGTCVTVLLASVGASRSTKRTTLIYPMFSVIDTTLFVTLYILIPFTDFVVSLTPDNPVAQVANVHTIFDTSTTIILLPFGTLLEKIAIAILPDKAVSIMDADQWFEGLMTSKHHFGISTIAINQIHDEIKGMLATAAENVSQSFKAVEGGTLEGIQAITDREEETDLNNMRLSRKISKILVLDQTPRGIDTLNRMYTILGNIERIGDHAMNLAEYVETIEEKGLQFSNYAKKEFAVMEETCRGGMELLMTAAAGDTQSPLLKVAEIEQRINDITRKFCQNQIDRMREGNCNVESSILYSEVLTDYGRIDDHMLNIAQAYDAIEWSGDRGQTAAAIA